MAKVVDAAHATGLTAAAIRIATGVTAAAAVAQAKRLPESEQAEIAQMFLALRERVDAATEVTAKKADAESRAEVKKNAAKEQ